MAKLFNVDGGSENKTRNIKLLIVILGIAAVILSTCIYYVRETNTTEHEKAEKADSMLGVHIKGAVESAGFYEVPYGTRVKDLGEVAGGFTENADLNGVNLAAFVKDGDEVYFPYKASKETGAIDLNTATADDLRKLSGIGETTAEKIISYRESVGKFHEVLELRDILGEKLYESIREKVYVK